MWGNSTGSRGLEREKVCYLQETSSERKWCSMPTPRSEGGQVRRSEVRKTEVRKSEVRKSEVWKSEVHKSDLEWNNVATLRPKVCLSGAYRHMAYCRDDGMMTGLLALKKASVESNFNSWLSSHYISDESPRTWLNLVKSRISISRCWRASNKLLPIRCIKPGFTVLLVIIGREVTYFRLCFIFRISNSRFLKTNCKLCFSLLFVFGLFVVLLRKFLL